MGNQLCCEGKEANKENKFFIAKSESSSVQSDGTTPVSHCSQFSGSAVTPTHSHRGGDINGMGNCMSPLRASTPHLRGNMMRKRHSRNPRDLYKIIRVLGTGSMGTVSQVQKRREVIGGSARKHNVSIRSQMQEQGLNDFIVNLAQLPFLGGLVQKLSGFHPVSSESTVFPSFHMSTHNPSVDDSNHSCISTTLSVSSTAVTPNASSHGYDPQNRKQQQQLQQQQIYNRRKFLENEHSALSGNSNNNANGSSNGSNYKVRYAMKSIHLSRVTDEAYISELKNEIEILKNLDHPHIVRPIETFEYRRELFVVMELCSGGDLYARDPYTEEQAARIISSVFSAISFMHQRNVIHRDIKYENIMFANSSSNAEVKLIDFGLSKKYFHEDDVLNEGVGTIYTMAPQVMLGEYTSKADVWSVGVVAFMLLSSHMPFYGKKRRHVVEKIMKCSYNFTGRRWRRVSQQAKNFVSDLLVFDPDDRPTACEALSSVWLNKRFDASIRSVTEDLMDNVQVSLEMFSSYTTIKKLALMVIAHKSTSEEIGFLRKAFSKYDTGGDGTVTFPEFRDCLAEYAYNEEELEIMFSGADIDGTGRLSYTEFLAATIEATGIMTEERLAEAFDRLDSDDSGYITIQNLREILGEDVPAVIIDEIIDESDVTRDHRISYDEFLALFDEELEEKRYSMLQSIVTRKLTRTHYQPSSVPSLLEPSSSIEEEDSYCKDDPACVMNRRI